MKIEMPYRFASPYKFSSTVFDTRAEALVGAAKCFLVTSDFLDAAELDSVGEAEIDFVFTHAELIAELAESMLAEKWFHRTDLEGATAQEVIDAITSTPKKG